MVDGELIDVRVRAIDPWGESPLRTLADAINEENLDLGAEYEPASQAAHAVDSTISPVELILIYVGTKAALHADPSGKPRSW